MNFNHQTGFADLNGARVYYEMAGAGHPLVLLHAGICDSRMWDAQVDAFAQHYQVVRYDLRGFGQTASVDGSFAHHHDLLALLNHLGIEKTYLLGCSMGGSAALDFALEQPERVAALILVGSSPSGYKANRPPPTQLDAVDAAVNAGDFERASELEVQIWVDGPSRTPDQVPSSIRDRVRVMNTIALQNEVLDLGQVEPLDPPAVQRLEEFQSPTLVVVGDLDQPRILDSAEFLVTHLPAVREAVIPGTAHLPNMEQPERFNELVLNFLANRCDYSDPVYYN